MAETKTTNLDLLLVEKGDYYNYIRQHKENYVKIDTAIGEKLDKGNVSTNYNTAKKIEDKIEILNEQAGLTITNLHSSIDTVRVLRRGENVIINVTTKASVSVVPGLITLFSISGEVLEYASSTLSSLSIATNPPFSRCSLANNNFSLPASIPLNGNAMQGQICTFVK